MEVLVVRSFQKQLCVAPINLHACKTCDPVIAHDWLVSEGAGFTLTDRCSDRAELGGK